MSENEKITFFNYLNALNKGKHGIEIDDKAYNQFMINRGLSLHLDTIAIANIANQFNKHISNKAHFAFMTSLVKPKERWGKWPKPEKNSNAKLISEYYEINMQKAYDIVDLFTEEQLKKIKEEMSIL